MNQQSRQIMFNKSTLLSLKAELLKKQQEVKSKKQLPQHKVENYKPPLPTKSSEEDNKQANFKDKLREIDTDEIEACKRSKSALERKSELYNHLSEGAGQSQLAGRFLVDFESKKNEDKPAATEEPEEPYDPFDDDDDDEWTNYTDCMGRTRRCLKTDLELYKRKDEQLMRVIREKDNTKDKKPPDEAAPAHTTVEADTEVPLLQQKTNDYLQSLRSKWEQKEQELVGKDRDIHYQDLLFDEARAHGVGYYGFSTEETARRREQAELSRTRVETQRAQDQAAARRAERDALVAGRVAAARARQRARAGLPPEDPQTEKKDEFDIGNLLDFVTEKKKEAAAKAKAQLSKQREERERERQKIRENYVREWDVGKEGTNGKEAGFREMTQEEYEEQQRSKRIQEFAPQPAGSSHSKNYFDDRGHFIGDQVLPVQKSWSDVRPNVASTNIVELPSNSGQGLYFSSVKESIDNAMSRNQSTLIVNELEVPHETPDRHRKRNLTGTEIEPPSTYDYYGPSSKKGKPELPFKLDGREAYEKGLKFLKEKESRKISKDYDFLES